MADIVCTRCGEPWDLDTFHDVADEQGITFSQALAAFRNEGCAGTGWMAQCERNGSMAAEAASVLFDLLGDDVDGIASELADWGFT